MKRGDIVVGRAPGEFTSKPRPYVVVQSDESLEHTSTVNLCPLSTNLTESRLIRIRIQPAPSNGLERISEIEVDLITTMRKSRLDTVIGVVTAPVMAQVDRALKRWLAL